MEFIDLGRQYDLIKEDVVTGINRVLESHRYIMGDEVRELEERLAFFCGRKYCLTCGSGTDALVIPLMAYELNPEDAVFVPSFTFFASAESINIAGGTPVFVDCDDTFNIDPVDLERKIKEVEAAGELRPRGVVTVDLFGRSADYDVIEPIVKKHGMFLVEDAAQGFGGKLQGKRNGSFGDASATSFFPAKPLGCYGDGGAVFTDDYSLYEVMKSIRVHGHGADKYDNVRLGINGRMDTLQAVVVLAKLALFEEELEKRQYVAQRYSAALCDFLKVPLVDDAHYSAWAQYTLMANDNEQRARIMEGLAEQGIPTMIYYPIPLHKQTAYANLGYENAELPMSEDIAGKVFSIPMHPYLSDDEIATVCAALVKQVEGL